MYADSLITVSPVFMAIMPNKNSITLEQSIKTNATVSYEGNVKIGSITSPHLASESEKTRLSLNGIYGVTPWIGIRRYGFALYKDSGSLYTQWSDPYITAQSQRYQVDLTYMSLMACQALSPKLFVGFTLNGVHQKATKEVTFLPSYDALLQGEDTTPTFSLGILYLPLPNAGIFIGRTTQANLILKGKIDAHLAGNTMTSSGTLHALRPAETLVGGFIKPNSNATLQIGLKQLHWANRTEEDINIDDATLEAYFGTPERHRWHDVRVFFGSVKYDFSNTFSLSLGGAVYNGAHDASSAYLSNVALGGKTLMSSLNAQLTSHWALGIHFSRNYVKGGNIDNETFHGNVSDSHRDLLTMAVKYSW